MVEIAKAIARDPSVLILDEATSALTSRDVETVYALLRDLKAQGVASIFISHRMHEVEALCDTLSVFRNGRHIETFAKGARSPREIVRLMIGRDVEAQFPPKPDRPRPAPLLSVRGLRWEDRLRGVDLAVGRGEIVGLGGLDGQGQKELLLALFGVLRGVEGEVSFGAARGLPSSPAAAKSGAARIALVPEDRKTEGLMLARPIADNLLAASYAEVSRGPFIDEARARAAIDEGLAKLRIKIGRPRGPGRDALRRQPAEGGHRQVADDPSRPDPPERPDPRHRRGHQAGALPPDARARRRGPGARCSTPPTMPSSSAAATASRSCTTAGWSPSSRAPRSPRRPSSPPRSTSGPPRERASA